MALGALREPWRPWTTDGKQRMGGYVTRYENNFDVSAATVGLGCDCCRADGSTAAANSS